VRFFATLNEPQVVANNGYRTGVHAPGRSDPEAALAAAHHLLLAHALGLQAIRAAAPRAAVGIALNLEPKQPATLHVLDQEAADLAHQQHNRWFLDPLVGLGYPEDGARAWHWRRQEILPGDLEAIATPMDFLGVNYYSRTVVRSPQLPPLDAGQVEVERTGLGWEVYPSGLTDVLEFAASRMRDLPLYVTENGAAYPVDSADPGRDPLRVSFLQRHLEAALDAIDHGVPLRGYFVWSLLDNFEWALGYAPRFGIVQVDYATLERRVRDSGRLIGKVALNGRLPEAESLPAAEGGRQ
jgi:beta-glucosidase